MKFNELRSIGHNIADSLASGTGLLIGVDGMDIFDEAGRSPEGFITVDFLTGTTEGGTPSPSLAHAISPYRDALGDLCRRHGTSPSAFRQLTARYSTSTLDVRFVVTVEDNDGRRAVDQYVGTPGRRVRVLDPLGRIRTRRAPLNPKTDTPENGTQSSLADQRDIESSPVDHPSPSVTSLRGDAFAQTLSSADQRCQPGLRYALLHTSDNQLGYWWRGFLLLWLLLPAQYLNMMFAPQWYASNPVCDSLGPLVWEMQVSLLPWAAIAALVTTIVVFALVRRREPGVSILDLEIGGTVKNLIVTAILALLALPLAIDIVLYVWDVVLPHSVTSDCRGTVEPVTLFMHRPLFQPAPFIEAGLVLWLLHIRALLLSKRAASTTSS
jgi:hypothetical protein